MTSLNLYIDGNHVPAEGDRRFTRANPVSGEAVTEAAAASVADATRAVDAAARAFPAWSATGPGERRAKLLAAAENLKARAPEIVAAMKDETGATEGWAMFNVMLAADMLVEAASLTTQIKGEILPSNRPGSTAFAIRQPAGVVLAMAPWNAPVILGVRAIATPLACGNTVVMKSSELCPRVHALVVEAVAEAGFPDGVLNAAALDHVTPDMRIYTEESFGPVAAIIRATSVDEAVRIANESEFGLAAAVFGRDTMQALAVARRIESGICHINGPTVHDEAQMPFGGVKASGYGRFGGSWGIAEFTELRWITIQDGPMHYPI